MNRRRVLKFVAAAACALMNCTAFAQSDKPVSVIVGYSAGGRADLLRGAGGTVRSSSVV